MSVGAQHGPRRMSRAAAIGLALPLLVATAGPGRAEDCQRLRAVRDTIELFGSRTADIPTARVGKNELPPDLCGVSTRNGRYRIMLGGQERWVLGSHFAAAGMPFEWEPLPQPEEKHAKAVRLGQLPPTGVGERGSGPAWVVVLEGDATITQTTSERFGKMADTFDPPAAVESGGKA